MILSDLPPGVSVMNEHVNPSDSEVEYDVHEDIKQDVAGHNMTDMDAFTAWRLGLAAFLQARKLGVKWPHD